MVATRAARWLTLLAAASCGGGKEAGPEGPSYRISGTISGSAVAGVAVTLSGAGGGSAATDKDGRYQLSGVRPGIYTVAPALAGHLFTPASQAVSVGDSDVAGVDFAARAAAGATLAISGTVSGALRVGLRLHLSGSNQATTSTDARGAFSFTGLGDGEYLVSLPLTGFERTPPSAAVALAGADVSRVDFAVSIPDVAEFATGAGGVGIAAGPDGNLWFAAGASMGRVTPGGVVTEFWVASGSNIQGVVVGPDGNVWFADMGGGRVGRITMEGEIVRYPVPGSPVGIAAGPDGNLWFTGAIAPSQLNAIGRITPAGEVVTFPIPTGNAGASGIAAGPDGNLWFAEAMVGRIGRITPAGVVTEFPVPTPQAAPLGIAAGPDGALWFVESGPSKLGRITTAGVVTEYPLPTALSYPWKIAADPEGNLWLTEFGAGKLGRYTPGGAMLELPLASGSEPNGIAVGPDGLVWFTMHGRSAVGRL